MNDTSKKIVSHGSAYLAGNILRYSVSFVMLPIYTRALTPADYGTIELLSMVIDFAGIIFGLRIGEAIFRFYLMPEDHKSKEQIIPTALVLTIFLNILGFAFLCGMSGFLSNAIFGGSEQQNLMILFSLSLLFQPVTEIPMIYIRAQQRPWLFVSFSSFKLFLQLSFNIYLVVLLGLGVKGVVLSAVFSGGIMSLLLGGYCLGKTGIYFSLHLAKRLALFSYPMILSSLISFYITFGDRYFLNLYGSLTDVGIYALGYKFGFLLTFIATGPFFSIWDSERYNVLKSPNAKETFQQVFIFFTVFSALIVVLLSVFSKNILMIMANREFWSASQIVPIILIAYFFQGWTGFCNIGILIEKKTMIITKSVMIVSVVITVLYLLLIPKFGAMGAAWATLIAFVLRFFYIHRHAARLYNMELPWGKVMRLFPPCFAAILISHFGPADLLQSLLLNIAVMLLIGYIITLIPVFSVDQRLILRRAFFKPWTLPITIRSILKGA